MSTPNDTSGSDQTHENQKALIVGLLAAFGTIILFGLVWLVAHIISTWLQARADQKELELEMQPLPRNRRRQVSRVIPSSEFREFDFATGNPDREVQSQMHPPPPAYIHQGTESTRGPSQSRKGTMENEVTTPQDDATLGRRPQKSHLADLPGLEDVDLRE